MKMLFEQGEARHETCRFGALTKAFRIEMSGEQAPAVVPLCHWRPSQPSPPAMSRAWGGAVEYERDCAVCTAHSALD